MKKYIYKILLLFLLIIPINVFAYSKYVIPGGETIGIEVNSKGILVVDFYKVDNKFIAKEAGFKTKSTEEYSSFILNASSIFTVVFGGNFSRPLGV